MEGRLQETLDLSNRRLRYLSQCGHYTSPSVLTLVLDDNQLTSLEGLDRFKNLVQLSSRRNKLFDMKAVRNLPRLVMLNLQNNSIVSIQGLDRLSSLRWLCLAGNRIKDASAVNSCLSLSHLDLSDNFIKKIPPLANLPVLKTLLLHGNALKSLNKLPAVLPASLETLTLAENGITDLNEFSSLKYLECLKQLSVMGNVAVTDAATKCFNCDYRCFILYWCPNLTVLDGTSVSEKERFLSYTLFSDHTHYPFSLGQHKELLQYLVTKKAYDSCDQFLMKPHPLPLNKENLSPNHDQFESLVTSLALSCDDKSDILDTLKALRCVQEMIDTEENLLLQETNEHKQDDRSLVSSKTTSLLKVSQLVLPVSVTGQLSSGETRSPTKSCDTLVGSCDQFNCDDASVHERLFQLCDGHVTAADGATVVRDLIVEDLEKSLREELTPDLPLSEVSSGHVTTDDVIKLPPETSDMNLHEDMSEPLGSLSCYFPVNEDATGSAQAGTLSLTYTLTTKSTHSHMTFSTSPPPPLTHTTDTGMSSCHADTVISDLHCSGNTTSTVSPLKATPTGKLSPAQIRSEAESLHLASVGVVQGEDQSFSGKQGSTREDRAAVLIQSLVRGYLCRRKKLLTLHKAAVIIQTAWRGYYARRYDPAVIHVRETLRRTKFEAYLALMFQQLQGCREELAHQVHTVQIQEETLRSLLCEVEELHELRRKEEKRKRESAARIIQRYWRNHKFKITTGNKGFTSAPLLSVCLSLQTQVNGLKSLLSDLTSKLETCTLRKRIVLPPPQSLHMSHHSPTCLLIQWSPATVQSIEETHPPLLGYRIYVNGESEGMVSSGKTKAYIEGLETTSTYRIIVRAVYEGNLESISSNAVVATLSQPLQYNTLEDVDFTTNEGDLPMETTSSVGSDFDLERTGQFIAVKSAGKGEDHDDIDCAATYEATSPTVFSSVKKDLFDSGVSPTCLKPYYKTSSEGIPNHSQSPVRSPGENSIKEGTQVDQSKEFSDHLIAVTCAASPVCTRGEGLVTSVTSSETLDLTPVQTINESEACWDPRSSGLSEKHACLTPESKPGRTNDMLESKFLEKDTLHTSSESNLHYQPSALYQLQSADSKQSNLLLHSRSRSDSALH